MDNDLQDRILALERENRCIKLLGFIGLLCAAGFIHTTTAQNTTDVTRTQSIQIIDRSGNVRAGLKTEDDGRPTLYFIDQDGKQRFHVGMFSKGNPVINLIADDGGIGQIGRRPGAKSFFTVRDQGQKIVWEAP